MTLNENELYALQTAQRFEREPFRFAAFGEALYPEAFHKAKCRNEANALAGAKALYRLKKLNLIILTEFGYDGEYKCALTSAGSASLKHTDYS